MTKLPKALDAELADINGRAGRLSYYRAGSGRPMLLVHSINAAGSAYEIKPIFERLRESRQVYAPDLPGFGLSDRSRRSYDVSLYVDALLDMLDVIAVDAGDTAVDALALSLSCEFLARAARDRPSRFRTLAFVSPTGFRRGSDRLRAPEGNTREMPLLSAFVNVPLWRRALFPGLVTPAVIRYFLRRTWGSGDIDPGLAAYDDLTTHQPGAEHAPLAFLSGKLFSGDIRNVYEALTQPIWLTHGVRGDFTDYSDAAWTESRDNWRLRVYESGALPHFELPEPFTSNYTDFLADADRG